MGMDSIPEKAREAGMSKRDDLLAEMKSLKNQKIEIEFRVDEIDKEIFVIDQAIAEEKKKKRLATATHVARRIRDDNGPGPGKVVRIKETTTGWTELESGERYKKSNKPDMSESLRIGGPWSGTWYRLVNIKEIERKCTLEACCDHDVA